MDTYGVEVRGETSTGAVGVASLALGQGTPVGTWVIDQVTLDQGSPSEVVLDDAALTAKGFTPDARTFTVTREDPGVAPSAPRVAFTPSAVDVTQFDSETVVEIDVVDAVPGVEAAAVTLTNGTESRVLWFDAEGDLVAGSPRDGTLRSSWTFGWWEPGTWAVQDVVLTDRYGEETTLVDPPTGGDWGSLTVNRADDVTLPGAGSPAVSPASVDVTSADGSASLTIQLTDDVSGLSEALVELADANDATLPTISVWVVPGDRVAGDGRNGTYVTQFTVPVRQPSGTYSASSVYVQDRAGNAGYVDMSPVSIQVQSAPDSSAPTLDSLLVTQPNANIGLADEDGIFGERDVEILATISDDVSGVSGTGIDVGLSSYTYTQPDGTPVTRGFGVAHRVSGNATAGTYALPIELLAPGDYSLTGMEIFDQDGHSVLLSEGELASANGGAAPRIAAVSLQDTASPSVTTVSLPSATFESGPDGQDVTIEVEAQDTGSTGNLPTGVDYFSAEFRSPNGQATIWFDSYCSYGTRCLVQGNDEAGRFRLTGWIPPYAQDGSWTLASVDVSDNAGNYRTYTDAEVSGDKILTITGTGDALAPDLTGLTFAPNPVDASSGDRTAVSVTASAADNRSGIDFMSVQVISSSAQQWASDTPSIRGGWAPERLSADLDGTLHLPRNAASGDWRVFVWLEDNAGNSVELDATQLAADGLTSSLTVNGVADAAAPVLASLEVSAEAIDSTAGDRFVMLTAHVTDVASGVQSVRADMGTGGWDDVNLIHVAGTGSDGWYAGAWRVDQYATPGARPITLDLRDVQGNSDTVTSAELAGAGPTSSIQVTSLGDASPDGVIDGTVTGPSGAVEGAYVSACNAAFDCGTATTDSAGHYEITGLPDGDYDIDVYPPSGLNAGAATVTDLYSRVGHRATADVTLTAPDQLPADGSTSVNNQTSGVPSVVYDEPFTLRTQGCTGALSATYTITQGTIVLASGSLTEGPPGSYSTTVSPLGSPGSSTVTIVIDCPTTPDVTIDFSLYIDPSGFVYDHDGSTTVPGATVTLYRSDSENGTYTQVPDGSDIMSPSNRANPDTTDGTGHYGWLTIAGWYRVDVTKEHCYRPGSYNPATNTVNPVTPSRLVPVPPEVTDLHVTIDCRNIAPVVSAARNGSGDVAPGTAVTFAASAGDANGSNAALTYAWDFGDGTSGSGATPSHSYSSAGSYTPKVTVTDDQGGTTTVTLAPVSVVVPTAPAPAPESPAAQPALAAADTTAPTVTLSKPGTTTLTASTTVAWTGSDAVGVRSYDVRYRSAAWNKALGGYVSPAAWQATAATSVVQSMAAGTLYCFSVRARDAAGNVSGWSSERCTARPLDDRSLTSAGAWAKTKGKVFYNRTIATAKGKGASLTRSGALPGRVALVASKGKGHGTVGVFYNGKLVKKVSLAATRTTTKSVIALPRLAKAGKIQLKVLTSGKTVQIDGLVTARR